MPSGKRGENPQNNGISPQHGKIGDFSETAFGVSGRYPKKSGDGRKKICAHPALENTPRRGKGSSSPLYAQVATSQPPNKEGDWNLVTKKRKWKSAKEKKGEEDPVRKAKQKLKPSTPARSGDAIKVWRWTASPAPTSWRKWRWRSTPGEQDSRSCLSEGPGRRKSFWPSKRGETFRPFARSSTRRSGRGRKFRPLSRRHPSKLGTLTRPSRKKRSCLSCGWHWAHRNLTVLQALHPEVARCFRCLGYGHGSQGCGHPDRKNACWRCGTTGHLARSRKAPPRCLTCLDSSQKDIAHDSGGGSCPVFREALRRLKGRNWSSCSSTSKGGRMPRTFWCRLPGRGGLCAAH